MKKKLGIRSQNVHDKITNKQQHFTSQILGDMLVIITSVQHFTRNSNYNSKTKELKSINWKGKAKVFSDTIFIMETFQFLIFRTKKAL